MQSKNKRPMSEQERSHVERIKSMACVIPSCRKPGPSEVHEIEQGLWWTSVPLCADCHRGSHNGIHGQRRIWNVNKFTELVALNETVRRLMTGAEE